MEIRPDYASSQIAESRTVCEINGRIVTASTSVRTPHESSVQYPLYPGIELPSDDTSTSGTYAGSVIPRRTSSARSQEDTSEDAERTPLDAFTWKAQLFHFLGLSRAKLDISSHATDTCRAMAWHKYQEILAVADQFDRVQIHSMRPSKGPPQACMSAPDIVLQHELQQRVSSVAWRPQSGSMLAVGGKGGVCLWALGKGPSGTTVQKVAARDGSTWMSFLSVNSNVVVSCLAWCPNGRLLAAGLDGMPGFKVWSVATGESVALRSSLEQVSFLEWSPDGSYLFSGGRGASFQVWETYHWWSMSWKHSPGSVLCGACWSPSSRTLLLAYQHNTQMAVLYLAGQFPSLSAQFLPTQLPLAQPQHQQQSGGSVNVYGRKRMESIAWDPQGERLAVLLGQDHESPAVVALYATTYKPLVTLRFIGLVEPGQIDSPHAVCFSPVNPAGCEGSLLAVRTSLQHVMFCPLYYLPANK